jgi:hypothetical protein
MTLKRIVYVQGDAKLDSTSGTAASSLAAVQAARTTDVQMGRARRAAHDTTQFWPVTNTARPGGRRVRADTTR